MKIRDKATGKVIEIQDNQAAEYGIAPPTTQAPQAGGMGGGLNITPEVAMMAQLLFPGKGADMVKGAYDIQRQSQMDTEKQQEKDKKAQESKSALKGFVDVATDLKQGTKDISVANAPLMKISGAFGNETALKQFERKKALVGQYLAKLVEKGRLSDADRNFYQDQILNIGPYGGQGGKEQAIDTIITDVIRLAGEDPANFDIAGSKKKDSQPTSNTNPAEVVQAVKDNPFFGFLNNLGQNAVDDYGNIVQGLKQAPGMAFDYSVPGAAYNYATEGIQGVQNMTPQSIAEVGKSVAKPYVDIAKNPAKATYENPITTLSALIPFAQAARARGVAGASEAGQATQGITSIVDDTAGANKVMSILDETPKSNAVSDASARVYAQQFTVPRKISYRLKPYETAKSILEYGFDPTDLQGTKSIAQSITGQNGVLTKMTREAVSNTKTPISIEGSLEVLGKADDIAPAVDANTLGRNVNTIRKIVDMNQNAGVYKMRADSAMDAVKKLEELGYQYKNASTDMSPSVPNEQLSKLYLDAADELASQIDRASGTEKVVDSMKTPENIAKLEAISPKLAKDFMKAKTVKDLRSIQAPFVRLGQMVDVTEAASITPFSNLTKGASKVVGTGVGGVAGGPVGALAGYLASPILEAILEPAMPRIQQGLAKGIYKTSQLPFLNK